MTQDQKFDSDINQGRSLGKGEVESSILSGSTRKSRKTRASEHTQKSISAVSGRTKRETGKSSRGKTVDSVHGAFRKFLRWHTRCCKHGFPTPEIATLAMLCARDIGVIKPRRGQHYAPAIEARMKEDMARLATLLAELPR
jgi:hypothetical protein